MRAVPFEDYVRQMSVHCDIGGMGWVELTFEAVFALIWTGADDSDVRSLKELLHGLLGFAQGCHFLWFCRKLSFCDWFRSCYDRGWFRGED